MSNAPRSAAPARLMPLAGPPIHPIHLVPRDNGATIGRHDTCDVRLPSDTVSRLHAKLFHDATGDWRLIDLNSRWGTFLNGVRVSSEAGIPLQSGDLIRISPWTFNFSAEGSSARAIDSLDDRDRMQTLVRATHLEHGRGGTGGGAMAEELLALLLEGAAAMQSATDERTMADALLDAACRGSGLANAAVLRPVDAEARVDLIATRNSSASMSYSRSLIAIATAGHVAELPPGQTDAAHSIIDLRIDAALCVPLMLGPSAAALLYLDTRGGDGRGGGDNDVGRAPLGSRTQRQWPSIVSFCVALGRIASLALANLKRIDMERRAALMETELRAAAEAQRWILPRRHVCVGQIRCAGESRPGRHVGGDFFDLIELPDNRLAVAVGDVAGKGIAASVLMTATQGFLHAALLQHGRPDAAVTQLNRFLSPRLAADRFVTLWVGVLDPASRQLQYVDAGHGYAFLLHRDEQHGPARLDAGDNMPLGVAPDLDYHSAAIEVAADDQLLVVSDGIIEQPAPSLQAGAAPVQFGTNGLAHIAARLICCADPIDQIFRSVIDHAGSPLLADDATAVLLRWE
jgi:sigma-B regulation protein RsbU (phosphoserine phosphatase)